MRSRKGVQSLKSKSPEYGSNFQKKWTAEFSKLVSIYQGSINGFQIMELRGTLTNPRKPKEPPRLSTPPSRDFKVPCGRGPQSLVSLFPKHQGKPCWAPILNPHTPDQRGCCNWKPLWGAGPMFVSRCQCHPLGVRGKQPTGNLDIDNFRKPQVEQYDDTKPSVVL